MAKAKNTVVYQTTTPLVAITAIVLAALVLFFLARLVSADTKVLGPDGQPVVVSEDANDGKGNIFNFFFGKDQSQKGNGEFGISLDAARTTEWISGRFTEDLQVQRQFEVIATSTINGFAITDSLTKATSTAYISGASSQTLCAIQNKSSETRTILGVSLGYATNTRTGGATNNLTISLSATQGATGTGTDVLFNAFNAVPTDGLQAITTTSSPQTAYVRWLPNWYLNFLIDSPTSTYTGNCRASFID